MHVVFYLLISASSMRVSQQFLMQLDSPPRQSSQSIRRDVLQRADRAECRLDLFPVFRVVDGFLRGKVTVNSIFVMHKMFNGHQNSGAPGFEVLSVRVTL
jgi:hypothetical protein